MTVQRGVEQCLETIRRGEKTETKTREGTERRAVINQQLTFEKCGKVVFRTRTL